MLVYRIVYNTLGLCNASFILLDIHVISPIPVLCYKIYSPGAGTHKKKSVQPADYLESELTEW